MKKTAPFFLPPGEPVPGVADGWYWYDAGATSGGIEVRNGRLVGGCPRFRESLFHRIGLEPKITANLEK